LTEIKTSRAPDMYMRLYCKEGIQKMKMNGYTANYWRTRADKIRAIRETMESEEDRSIMADIAADYDRLHD
jgi:hypothetical protein